MKFKTKTEGAIMHTERWIDDNHESVYKEMEIIRNDLAKIIEENNNAIHQRLTNEATDLINSIDELDRKIDSRVDKLSDKFDNLKKELPIKTLY
jgi:molecular chaperone GrpE (heat shock protein)